MILRNQPSIVVAKHRKTFGQYLDFALSVVGGMCFLFGVVFTQEIHAPDAAVDRKIAIGCFILMGICVIAACDRLSVLTSSIALPSAFLFLKFWSSGDVGALWRGIVFLALSFAVLAIAALIVYFRDR
jgi:predicted membrane channel-forming protein YqfA (hemolysin III family)